MRAADGEVGLLEEPCMSVMRCICGCVRSAAVAALAVVVVSNGGRCVEHGGAHKPAIALANCVREPAARCVVRGCMCVHVCSYVGAQRWGVVLPPTSVSVSEPMGMAEYQRFWNIFLTQNPDTVCQR